jgi:hypothetical protein
VRANALLRSIGAAGLIDKVTVQGLISYPLACKLAVSSSSVGPPASTLRLERGVTVLLPTALQVFKPAQ